MLASAWTHCRDTAPCANITKCVRCQAVTSLSRSDWYAVGFYQLVKDQVGEGGLPSFSAYKVVLDSHGYPPELHGWLMQTAGMLHRILNKIEAVDWVRELGKPFKRVTTEDVSDD